MRISRPTPEVAQAAVELFKALGNEHRLVVRPAARANPCCAKHGDHYDEH